MQDKAYKKKRFHGRRPAAAVAALAAFLTMACSTEDVVLNHSDVVLDHSDADLPDTAPDPGCSSGQVNCDGQCVDISSNRIHCGQCHRECQPTEQCTGGECTNECSAAETCNGIDDNCNGLIDEDFDCSVGEEVECTTSCGSTGTGICGINCSLPTPGACRPPDEMCNGQDDDCDGSCDNGLGCCAGDTESCPTTCGSTGTRTCSASCSWGACVPPPETCNGRDDDCDAACDNGLGCCAGDTGSCPTTCGSTGTRTCSASCSWGTCTPPVETCNGVDDNCDGTVDEGCTGTIRVRIDTSQAGDTFLRYLTAVLDCMNMANTNCYVSSGCVSTDCDSGERCNVGTSYGGTYYHDFTASFGPHHICFFPSSTSTYTWNATIYIYQGGTWVAMTPTRNDVTGNNWLCAYPVTPE